MTTLKNHIELNRSFHELSLDKHASDDVELNRHFGRIRTQPNRNNSYLLK